MNKKESAWKEYYLAHCKDKFINNIDNTDLKYGEVIYQTSPIGKITKNKWIVTKFENQYNVFVCRCNQANFNKNSMHFAACFTSKDDAMAFAYKMLLISNGKLTRKTIA